MISWIVIVFFILTRYEQQQLLEQLDTMQLKDSY